MKILITPVSVYPATATQIEFLPAEIYYGVTAKSQYILQNAESQNLISDWVSMTPEQYQLWGNDDAYAINFILQTLGELPSKSGVWPLIVKVKEQAEAQVPKPNEAST